MRVRVSLSTGSLYGYPLERAFRLAAGLGLDGVEVFLSDAILAAGPAALLEVAERAHAPVLSLHFPPLGRCGEAETLATYERTAEFAAGIPSCEAVVVHTSAAVSLHGKSGQTYLQALVCCQQRLRGTRASISVENRGVGVVPSRPAHLDDLVNLRRLAEEWDLGLTYDVGHAASWGVDVVRAYEILGQRVGNIHLSNSHARGWPASSPSLRAHLRDHQPLDAGVLPIDEFLGVLLARRYAGLVTLEISPVALHLPWPWRAAARLADSVDRCRAALTTVPRQRGSRERGSGIRG